MDEEYDVIVLGMCLRDKMVGWFVDAETSRYWTDGMCSFGLAECGGQEGASYGRVSCMLAELS